MRTRHTCNRHTCTHHGYTRHTSETGHPGGLQAQMGLYNMQAQTHEDLQDWLNFDKV